MNTPVAPESSRISAFAGLVLLIGLVIGLTTTPTMAMAAASDPIAFEDAALESCVLAQLGSPAGTQVTEADMASLTSLGCRDSVISQVDPLAFATRLTHLDLYGNQISDISPLTELASLGTLNLARNQVSHLPSLAGLTSLTDLYLNYNQITDIAPLASVKSLRAALLQGNQISDLSPLGGLDSLEIVYVAVNAVRDISPLQGLPRLQTLNATNQRLPLVEVATGTPMLSLAVGIDGETIPMTVASGAGTVAGNEIIWTADGAAAAEWEYSFPLGQSRGLFSGGFEVSVTTVPEAPEVSLEGVPVRGVVGTSYRYDFLLTGKPSIPEVSVIDGNLPAGLELSADGKLAGTPTEAGTFSFDVRVSNGAAEKTYGLTVVVMDAEAPGPGDENNGGHPGGGDVPGRSDAPQLATSGSGDTRLAIGAGSVGLVMAGLAALFARRHLLQRS